MTERQRQSRHPFEVATLTALAVIAVSQLTLGPSGSRVVLSMPGWSQFLFAITLLVGALLALMSTQMVGEGGRRCEVAGMLLCAVPLGAYALSVVDITSVWITNPAFAFGGSALGCAVRAGQLWRRR